MLDCNQRRKEEEKRKKEKRKMQFISKDFKLVLNDFPGQETKIVATKQQQ